MRFSYRHENDEEREANQLALIAATLRRREVEQFCAWFEIAGNWLSTVSQ